MAGTGEYLLKRTDGKWFDVGPKNFEITLVPSSLPWHKVEGWGDFRITVKGCDISFSYEDPGIQVVFEHDVFTPEEERGLVVEMLENITKATGQKGEVLAM